MKLQYNRIVRRMHLQYNRIAVAILISYFTASVNSVVNPQNDEPDFFRIQEHPIVGPDSEFDKNPFVPNKVGKPALPANIDNCRCGEHSHNTPSMENEELCGEKPREIREITPSVASFVVNGSITDKSQFPWVVALVERRANNSAIHFCGGTLISSRLVLTATHCFVRRSINKTEVWLNEKDLVLNTGPDHKTLKIKASRLIVHPNYNPIMNYNDIVLLELSEPVDISNTSLRPICLPNSVEYDKKEFGYTAGWGQTSYKGPKSDKLRHTCLPLLSHEQCVNKSVMHYKDRVTEWMICAGDIRNGGKDACPGDSGGPLFVQHEERYYLIGIVSWGEQCALPMRPGVYTRVTKYMPWIYQQSSEVQNNWMCGY